MAKEENETPTDAAHVVVGIDGSPASEDALEWAARQAEITHSSLEVIAAWDWPSTYGWSVPFPTGFDPEAASETLLGRVAQAARDRHPVLEITTRSVQGHPAPALVEASKGASLLVVGSRGHGEFVGMLIGSVSEFCATKAHCPVLVHRSLH